MLEILLWAVLIGGLPTAGYYLFQYGRRLHARGRRLKENGTDPEDASEQWRAELLFTVNVCVWAGFGLMICHLLEAVSQAR